MGRWIFYAAVALLAFFAWDIWNNNGEWGRDAGQVVSRVVDNSLTRIGWPADGH